MCLSSLVSQGLLKNSTPRCWSILMIPTASRRLSGAPYRCHSLNAASGTNSLFRVLLKNDIQHWAERFLAALERDPRAPSHLEQMPSIALS